jgi:hypothetical protein
VTEKNAIIRLLQSVERRSRVNRILHDTASSLAISLLIPVGFKIVDLVSPFRGTTILVFLSLWVAATIGWIAWRSRGRDALENIAATIDNKTGNHDELKSAYWFIRHPKDSSWVDVLIQRASINAAKLRPDTLFPRRMPKASYSVAGLILLLGVLNFIPLSWNHNWLLLQGAPAYALTNAQKEILDKALELLQKAEQLQDKKLAEALARMIQGLRDGSLSQNQLSRTLADVQQALADRKLEAANITDGLERVARALEPAALTKPIADPLLVLDLKNAASKTRDLESNLDKTTPAALQSAAERFQEASDVAGKGLEQLSQYMKDAASLLKRNDNTAAKQGLEQVAKEFERLQRVLDSQKLSNQASDQISKLQDSVAGNPGEVSGQESQPGDAQMSSDGQGQGESNGEGQGDGEGVGQGEGQGQGQGEGEGEAQGEGEGGDGEGVGQNGNGPPGGHGVGLSGPLPARGDPTSLEVQLQKDGMPVQPTRGSRPETIDEASQRERSKLDYRNVPSELSPAKKDSLHQTTVPTEQRLLIQKYFENLRKP